MKLFVLLFIFSSFAMGEESLTIEMLPFSRTQSYPLSPYTKIVVFSAPRTGSSLVYNIMRFLFESDECLSMPHNDFYRDGYVFKTHRFEEIESIKEEEHVLYVVTVRHPISACISHYRICPRKINDIESFARKLLNRHRDTIDLCKKMQGSGKSLLFLKYEDFEKDLTVIFDTLESQLLIKINSEDKEKIRRGYAKENIYNSIKSFDTFNDCLPLSGFHGKHLNVDPYKPPSQFLFWLDHYFPRIEPAFAEFQYFRKKP